MGAAFKRVRDKIIELEPYSAIKFDNQSLVDKYNSRLSVFQRIISIVPDVDDQIMKKEMKVLATMLKAIVDYQIMSMKVELSLIRIMKEKFNA